MSRERTTAKQTENREPNETLFGFIILVGQNITQTSDDQFQD